MLNAATYLEVISGQRRGLGASALRAVLAAAEPVYAAVVRCRNRRYDRGRAEIRHVASPVISVGNLTLGGTGKTPMVKWIARWLRSRHLRVALVSRGYGAEQGARNDEALELEHALPDVPHLQNPDRVAAAQIAMEELAAQVILLDDGFQHRRLARDLDIVLLDALEPFGFGHLLPRGALREPLSSLRRAQVVCLSRADLLDASSRARIRNRVEQIAPTAAWCEAAHAPQHVLDSSGEIASLDELQGRRIAAFCGIGNPAAFRRTLDALGCNVVAWRTFPDHHPFTAADVEKLSKWSAESSSDSVICTHKDLVKLQVDQLGGRPLRAVVVEMEVRLGQAEVEALLAQCVASVKRQDLLVDD